MISKDAALKLQETATALHAADEKLRLMHDPTENTEFVQENATDYLEKLDAHQKQIEAAKQDSSNES